MSNFIFNNAKGKVAYYAGLPGTGDGLILVPLLTSTIEPDELMIEKTTLSSVLAVSGEQTTMGRQTLSGVTVTVDAATDSVKVDANDTVFPAATGAAIAAMLVCYVPEVGISPDSDIVPLTKHDFSAIPNAIDIPVQISNNGLFVATASVV